jgi:ATP-dependent Clp protease ATP-binding subunit ClpX
MEETLLAVMYEVPSRKDVERVIVTPEAVAKEAAPTYVLRGAGPKRSKSEKALDKAAQEKSA